MEPNKYDVQRGSRCLGGCTDKLSISKHMPLEVSKAWNEHDRRSRIVVAIWNRLEKHLVLGGGAASRSVPSAKLWHLRLRSLKARMRT